MIKFLEKNAPYIVFFVFISFLAIVFTDYQLNYGVVGIQSEKGIVIEEIVRKESGRHDSWDAFYYKILDSKGNLLTVSSKLAQDPKTIAGDSVNIIYNLKGSSQNSLFFYNKGRTEKEIKSVTKIDK
jgi:hypothetical protein